MFCQEQQLGNIGRDPMLWCFSHSSGSLWGHRHGLPQSEGQRPPSRVQVHRKKDTDPELVLAGTDSRQFPQRDSTHGAGLDCTARSCVSGELTRVLPGVGQFVMALWPQFKAHAVLNLCPGSVPTRRTLRLGDTHIPPALDRVLSTPECPLPDLDPGDQ